MESPSPNPPPTLLESKTNSDALFQDVPFHQLVEQDITQMNDAQLAALLNTTRMRRVSPSERRVANSNAVKRLTGKKAAKPVSENFSHLI